MDAVHDVDPSPKTNVGELIRAQRQRQKMRQADLAATVGVTSRTIGAWERGETEPPLGFVPIIGSALGVRFVDDGAGHYAALDAIPDTPPDTPPTVVNIVVVTSTDEAVEVVRRIQAGLDPQ